MVHSVDNNYGMNEIQIVIKFIFKSDLIRMKTACFVMLKFTNQHKNGFSNGQSATSLLLISEHFQSLQSG